METGICKLCLEYTHLCKSHLISEFAYTPLYDSKGRTFEIAIADKFSKITPGRYIQKGKREIMLCKKCEGKFSKYENTLKKELRNVIEFATKYENLLYNEWFPFRLKYEEIKYAVLSIFWRLAVSKQPELKGYNLGRYSENIRIGLYEEKFFKQNDYPVYLNVIFNPTDRGRIIHKDFISTFQKPKRINGNLIFSIGMYGFWFDILLKDNLNFNKGIYNPVLPDGNTIIVPKPINDFFLDIRAFHRFVSNKEIEKKFSQLNY